MMDNLPPTNFEDRPEYIPTIEEVEGVFRRLTEKEFTQRRVRADKKGLYLLEVFVSGDTDGETIEYRYMRAGKYPEGETAVTGIHVVYYIDDYPISGTSAASLIDGEWKIL
jgi:hypothetical protein